KLRPRPCSGPVASRYEPHPASGQQPRMTGSFTASLYRGFRIRREPHSMMTACGVILHELAYCEPDRAQLLAILRWCQTGVVEGCSMIRADRLSFGRTTRKHQRCTGLGMQGEAAEHAALVLHTEVEQAVPGQNPGEAFIEVDLAHVS